MSRGGQLPIRHLLLGKQPSTEPLPTRIAPSIRSLLAEPTWSVRSLLPPRTDKIRSERPDAVGSELELEHGNEHEEVEQVHNGNQEITREKLHHLLRLSALPPPRNVREERKLLNSLDRHLHFVRAVQNVDTSKPPTWDSPRPNPTHTVANQVWVAGSDTEIQEVEPLVTIRDETFEAIAEETISLGDLWPTLQKEEKRGFNKAVRRRWKVNTNWDGEGLQTLQESSSNSISESETTSSLNLNIAPDQISSASRLDTTDTTNSNDTQTSTRSTATTTTPNHKEALLEKRTWWINADNLGSGLETRKRGKYFFVRKGKKVDESGRPQPQSQSQLQQETDVGGEEGGRERG